MVRDIYKECFNWLDSDLAVKIFLDRYSKKDVRTDKPDPLPGQTVLFRPSPAVKHMGRVRTVSNGLVTVESLPEGDLYYIPTSELDIPMENPDDMWKRVAKAVASVEETEHLRTVYEEQFYDLLSDWKFLPGGRILAGAGLPGVTLANCFVISSPIDTREGIFENLSKMAELMARGGGVGVNISTLRPRYSYVAGVNGRSSGAVSWAEMYSQTTGLIEQGGCVPLDALISTDKGLLPAGELAERLESGEEIKSQTRKGLRRFSHVFRNGPKQMVELTTKHGNKIIVSKDHKVMIFEGGNFVMKPAERLTKNDAVFVQLDKGTFEVPEVALSSIEQEVRFGAKEVVFPKTLSKDLAYFLGYCYGNASVGGENVKRMTISVPTDRQLIVDRLLEISNNLFGIDPEVKDGDGKVVVLTFSRTNLVKWLKHNGICKEKSDKVCVPDSIFKSPKEVQGAFVSGWFDADGCDRGLKAGYGIDSVSRKAVEGLQTLLLFNGILSEVTWTSRKGNWKDIGRLSVTGSSFKEKFFEFMGMSLKDKNIKSHRVLDHVFKNSDGDVKSKLLSLFPTSLFPTTIENIVYLEGLVETVDFEVEDVHTIGVGGLATSNSRRGALLLLLEDWHPDVLEFIEVKKNMTRINNANISVDISDEFMKAVKEDGDWDLWFPDTSCDLYRTKCNNKETINPRQWKADGHPVVVYKTVKAKEIWKKITESAWASAEPGVLFRGTIERDSNSSYYPEGRLICTNPCVTGDTLIATVEQGPVPFKELAERGEDVKVYSWDPVYKQACVSWMRRPHKTREKAEILEIEFCSGLKLKLTPDHSLYTFRGEKVKAKDLKIGKSVRAYAVSRHRDGQLRAHNGDSGNRYVHQLVWECSHGKVPDGYIIHHKNHNPEDNRLENLQLMSAVEHNQEHYPSRHANGFKGHKNFPEVLAKAKKRKIENHKVVSIRKSGCEDVYNGMVEGSHTYVICDPSYRGSSDKGVFSGIVSANCGEQNLPEGGVCNLGHLNLAKFSTPDYQESLEYYTKLAVRFLDNVVSLSEYYIDYVAEKQRGERRVGLGTLGLAEFLIRKQIRYGSDLSIGYIDVLYKNISQWAYEESQYLGELKGSFKFYDSSKVSETSFLYRTLGRPEKMRNVCILTQAPTGTVGTMVNTSTGIEPFFMFQWQRNGRLGSYTESVKCYEDFVKENPGKEIPSYFVNAMMLDPRDHVRVQATIQKYTDSSISKTCNVPENWTPEMVEELYSLMYETGCKGGTIYRDNSRNEQVLEAVKSKKDDKKKEEFNEEPIKKQVPRSRTGSTVSIKSNLGTVHVTLNSVGSPHEVFVNVGKAGTDIQSMAEGIGRLVSLSLQHGVRAEDIFSQLSGIGGSKAVGFGPNKVSSLPDAVAKAIKEVWLDEADIKSSMDLCPDCGDQSLVSQGGCEACSSCGYSACS